MLTILAPPVTCHAAGWADTRVVGPLVVRADFSLAPITAKLTELAALQADLTGTLGVAAAKEPVEVYLFHDKATYTQYLNRYLPNVPYRRALYVKSEGPGRVFAYWSRELEVDLRHECTHALLHASLPVVPLWLDEGLAQYFEVPGPQRADEHPHLGSVRWAVRWGNLLPIETLERKAGVTEMGRTEYRDSWAWVHFMIHGPMAARTELAGYLADLLASRPPGVLSQRLRQRMPGIDRQAAEHFRNWNAKKSGMLGLFR